MKDFFTAQDFNSFIPEYAAVNPTIAEHMAARANRKFNTLIESWPVIHSTNPCNFWARDTIKQFVDPEITYKARLAFVEELLPEKSSAQKIKELKNGKSK